MPPPSQNGFFFCWLPVFSRMGHTAIPKIELTMLLLLLLIFAPVLYWWQVACFPQFCSEENPAKYPPVTAGEYILGKYSQTHQDFDKNQDADS